MYANNDPNNNTDPSGLIDSIIVNGKQPSPSEYPFPFPMVDVSPPDPNPFSLLDFDPSKPDARRNGKDSNKCYGPPDAPGTGASKEGLTKVVHANAAQARDQISNPFSLLWFRNQVKNKGPWDYKQLNPGYQDFGNYNYGYAGSALQISGTFLLQEAGAAQIAAGTSQPGWGSPGFLGMIGGTPPYGDDPHDQEMIKHGISDEANGC